MKRTDEEYSTIQELLEARTSIKKRLDPIKEYLSNINSSSVSIRIDFTTCKKELPYYFFKDDDKTDVTFPLLKAMEKTLEDKLQEIEQNIESALAPF